LLGEDFNPDLGTGTKPSPKPAVEKVEADDFADEDEVNGKIADAEDDASAVDTVTFGLETDDDQIVKVYVAVTDADAFEEKLSAMLGEVDDIEELLKTLGEEFDIVDIEWPDDEDAEDEDKEDLEEPTDDEEMPDDETGEEGEPKEKSPEEKAAAKEAILARLRNKLEQRLDEDSVDLGIDPDTNDIMQRYQNQYTQLGLAVLMELNLTPVMLKLMISRNPAYIRELTIKMRELGNVNRNLLRRVFGLNKDNKDVEPE
jgi:hypothetical protein